MRTGARIADQMDQRMGRAAARPLRQVRARLLTGWARVVTAHPWAVLVASLALAAGAVWWTAERMTFLSDRSDMIDRSLPWQQRYFAYQRAFPSWNDAVVVVERAGAPPATVDAFLGALAARLKNDPTFPAVDAGFPTKDAPPGLLLSEPVERVREVASELRRAAPALAARSLGDLLSLSTLAPDLSAQQRAELTGLLRRATRAGLGESGDTGVLGLPSPDSMQWLTTPSGRFSVVLVSLTRAVAAGDRDVNVEARPIAALRAHVRALLSEARFRDVRVGVTGVPVLEADESGQAMVDGARAGALSLILIAGLMFWTYRGVVIPLLALLALLIGVAWSFGWLTVSVGHLQLLSSIFAAILLGLGVDNAIHLIARLELVRPDHDHMPPAIEDAFRAVGPGVVTSALTVAAAFLAMTLTRFNGVAEMGVIAAGGVILCAIAVMSCFPALLEVIPHPERHLRKRTGGRRQPFLRGRLNIVDRRAGLFASIALVVFAGAAWIGSGVRYDPDLMKLLPEGSESAVWEHRLTEDDQRSAWHAVVLAGSEAEAARLAESLRAAPGVAAVEGAGMLFPARLEEKEAVLRGLPAPPAGAEDVSGEPGDPRPAAAAIAARWEVTDAALAGAARSLASLDDAQARRAAEAFLRDRARLAETVTALRGAAEPTPAQLPAALRRQFVGLDGSLLLKVYPETPPAGESVLAPQNLNRFMGAVLRVAPNATGPASQIYESTRVISRAYVLAAVYSLAAIMLLLLVDFRSLADVACAMAPVLIGSAMLAAMMRLADISLNFANMIVLPLIVGLGVSAGVHAVNRWKQQPYDPPAGLAGGSGRGILLTTLTTMFGFACMLTAHHRGIRSLGFVMSVGLLLVLIATVFFVPAILRLRTRLHDRRTGGGAQAGRDGADGSSEAEGDGGMIEVSAAARGADSVTPSTGRA